MPRVTAFVVACAIFAVALAPPLARASTIEASSTVSLSQDPGFEGLYKYTLTVTWALDRHDPSHLDLFLDLATFEGSCHSQAVRFPAPAGTSSGVDPLGQPCLLDYRGYFLCKTDPSIPYTALGATVKWEPVEDGCSTDETGSGRFVFYSPVAPALAGSHPNAVAIKHGQDVDFGDLVGSLPIDPSGAPGPLADPVVINEFLVRPYGEQREFVELFNNTGQPVDLSGWYLEVFNSEYTAVSYSLFVPGDSLQPGGFRVQADSTFYQTCYNCDVLLYSARGLRPRALQALGDDFLFDEGGVILLHDDTGQVVDQVAYGNAGSAPISCPIVVPAGYPRPPGFEAAPSEYEGGPPGTVTGDGVTAADAETLSTSTNRFPDGNDTDNDGADFNIGSPTPEASNVSTTPDLGSSTRINSVYVYPQNGDADPANESLQFYNPTPETKDLRNYRISDGYLIQPIFAPGGEIPLEPAQKYTVFHGLNGTISFEFEEEDRVDLYEERPEGLVRIDQLGWSRLPPFFPDSCITRIPDGAGPSGGWDWDTSGGFVFLFYVDECGLEAPNVAVSAGATGGATLAAPWPNPARGSARFEFAVGPQAGGRTAAHVTVFDVAGRRVRVFGEGSYPAGRHAAVWDGTAADGRPVASGVYFARLFVGGRPVGQVRTLVWLRE